MKDSILPADLDRLLEDGVDVKVLDVRLEADRVEVEYPIPSAQWRNPDSVAEWSRDFGDAEELVVFCVHGHQVSQSTRDALRRRGVKACIVEGGIEAWCAYAKVKDSRGSDSSSGPLRF
jgi:rhodanese-related sulfurtransferase